MLGVRAKSKLASEQSFFRPSPQGEEPQHHLRKFLQFRSRGHAKKLEIVLSKAKKKKRYIE
jgi:hypothetical protein